MTSVRHIGQRSLGASLKLPDSFLDVAGAVGLQIPDLATAQVSFSFHRQKRDGAWGWATSIHLDRLRIHAPCRLVR